MNTIVTTATKAVSPALSAVMTPAVAIEILGTGVQLVGSLLQYRAGCQQLELQRETMHRQADLAEKQLKKEFLKQMAELQVFANGFGITIQQIGQQNLNQMQALKQIEASEQNFWRVYFADNLPQEHKNMAMQMIGKLQDERRFLLQQHRATDNQAILQAFNTFASKFDFNPKMLK